MGPKSESFVLMRRQREVGVYRLTGKSEREWVQAAFCEAQMTDNCELQKRIFGGKMKEGAGEVKNLLFYAGLQSCVHISPAYVQPL
jgi:hypothetical protein